MSFINEVNRFARAVGVAANNIGTRINRGFEFGSRSFYVLYEIDGFEKMTKAGIATLGALHYFIPSINGTFAACIKTMEAEKDLLYATQFIPAMAAYIDRETLSFQLPRKGKNGPIDYAKMLNGIGGFCEAGKFLQKYKVFSFSTCTYLANQIGSVKLFNLRLDDIPVVRSLFDKPKDFFVFCASAYEDYELLYKKGLWDAAKGTFKWNLVDLLKFASSTGKMFLITFGKFYYNRWWFVIADVITQNSSLLGLVVKCNKARAERFADPIRYSRMMS